MKWVAAVLFSLIPLLPPLCFLHAQAISPGKGVDSGQASAIAAYESRTSILNINNLWLRIQNDGLIGRDPLRGLGLTYPMQYGGLLYCENLIWVGKVKDGRVPELRTGGGLYRAGTVPGAILNKGVSESPESPAVRVYRVRPDYKEADLTLDAAGYFNVAIANVTPEMVVAVREQYERDWKEWPWQKGAPFVDGNANGVMDPGEKPGLLDADQVAWFVYNDLDEAVCASFYGDPSIGLEVQVTLWAYKDVPAFENVIFKRYRVIYKGTVSTPTNSAIDSMYLLQFSDPDIGNAGDDLGGCDSVLSLGFGYSGGYPDMQYKPLGWQSPGIGYALLQGPLVPGNESNVGIFNFQERVGVRNLPMTSCAVHLTGLGDGLNEPSYGTRTSFHWNVARGFRPRFRESWLTPDEPWIAPEGRATKFMYSGDPISRTGWIASRPSSSWTGADFPGGDVRFWLNTGPFTMALGDTQEVVVAILACMASDGKQSTAVLKYYTRLLRTKYPNLAEGVGKREAAVRAATPTEFLLEQNYPNPFNPATRIRYDIPIGATVRLSVFDLLGRAVKVLVDEEQLAGSYLVEWNGSDDKGNLVPSGIYFYHLNVRGHALTKKMMLVR